MPLHLFFYLKKYLVHLQLVFIVDEFLGSSTLSLDHNSICSWFLVANSFNLCDIPVDAIMTRRTGDDTCMIPSNAVCKLAFN